MLIGSSSDADDVFMFYALEKKLVKARYPVRIKRSDIQTLNRMAFQGRIDASSVSFAAYPHFSRKYSLLSCGSSFGYSYGPVIVSKRQLNRLEGMKIAIPGNNTTAFLLLNIFESGFTPVEMKFDKIMGAVRAGRVDAGIVLHEGQLTYRRFGLRKHASLGEMWFERTRLPLPLGAVAAKNKIAKEASRAIKLSIAYSMAFPEGALKHAKKFSKGLTDFELKKYLRMYANETSLNLGKKEKKGVEKLYSMGYKKGLIPKVKLHFI